MTGQVYILDRDDQIRWYVDDDWVSYMLDLHGNHRVVREWIEETCRGKVVISGEGKIPPNGGMYHPTELIFKNIQRNHYRIYFELMDDALLFKLTWGGGSTEDTE